MCIRDSLRTDKIPDLEKIPPPGCSPSHTRKTDHGQAGLMATLVFLRSVVAS